jgi:hypothetical protein
MKNDSIVERSLGSIMMIGVNAVRAQISMQQFTKNLAAYQEEEAKKYEERRVKTEQQKHCIYRESGSPLLTGAMCGYVFADEPKKKTAVWVSEPKGIKSRQLGDKWQHGHCLIRHV